MIKAELYFISLYVFNHGSGVDVWGSRSAGWLVGLSPALIQIELSE